jgi:hypothetical protein
MTPTARIILLLIVVLAPLKRLEDAGISCPSILLVIDPFHFQHPRVCFET